MSTEIRQRRVKGLLQEELATLIPGDLDDPKLALVSVTDVVVSKDLKNVRVFVTTTDEEVTPQMVLSRLNKALPLLRSQVAERLSTRVVPEISFTYDETGARSSRLDEIFLQLKQEEGQKPPATTEPATTEPATTEPATIVPEAALEDAAKVSGASA